MARTKTPEFQTHDVTNEGQRGRPSHLVIRGFRRERILDSRGESLGEVELEPQADGSVVMTAIVDGRKKSITFAAKKRAAKGQASH